MCRRTSSTTVRSPRWREPQSATPSAVRPKGGRRTRSPRTSARRSRAIVPSIRMTKGLEQAVLALPQGRRPHHRRHADDARARQGLRREARPPRRLRRRVEADAAADRGPGLDPRARARGSALPPPLPRREVAGRAAQASGTAIRAKRASATSSTAAPRCTSRRSGSPMPATPTGAFAEAADVAGAHQSSYGREAAAGPGGRRRRGDAPGRDGRPTSSTPRSRWRTTARALRSTRSRRRHRR